MNVVSDRKMLTQPSELSNLLRSEKVSQRAGLRAVGMLKSREGYLYAGYPNFMELFGRDSLIASIQLMDIDSRIARRTIEKLSELQGRKYDPSTGEKPGKIIHEFVPNECLSVPEVYEKVNKIGWLRPEVPLYFSIDSTPLFLIAFGEYYRKTGDAQFVVRMFNSIRNAASFITGNMEAHARSPSESGFLSYEKPAEGSGLMSQSWKDGIGKLLDSAEAPVAVVEVQGYAYAALLAAASLGRVAGYYGLSDALARKAALLKQQFLREFWSEENGYFSLAIDGNGKRIDEVTSNPGHLLFTGILDSVGKKAVADRLMKEDMLTPYGIRTHSALSAHFNPLEYQLGSVWPHDNFIIAKGMEGIGGRYAEISADIGRRISSGMEAQGSFVEYYGVDGAGRIIPQEEMRIRPAAVQAWSVGAYLYFQKARRETHDLSQHR